MEYPTSFTEWIDGAIRYSKAVCDKFAEDFAKNGAYALNDCDDVFKNAARLDLAEQIKRSLEEAMKNNVPDQIAYLKDCFLHTLFADVASPPPVM